MFEFFPISILPSPLELRQLVPAGQVAKKQPGVKKGRKSELHINFKIRKHFKAKWMGKGRKKMDPWPKASS